MAAADATEAQLAAANEAGKAAAARKKEMVDQAKVRVDARSCVTVQLLHLR